MQSQFSYYYDGVRYTDTNIAFLRSLTHKSEDQQSVIDGILESERRFLDENAR
ncbi:hypothetical protein ABMX95_01735 [Vibrio vulnificus]|uniref:hypothetical protein n=1 Tax=Vibrio vulnificus TaxID=672 RepID=UPI00405988CB